MSDPVEYEEVQPPRQAAQRTVKTKIAGYDVSARAVAPAIQGTLDYGPFKLAGQVGINKGSWIRVACDADEIEDLIRILRMIQSIETA